MYAEGVRKPYREQNFDTVHGEEGGPEDRPLIVQFCANNAEQLLASAKLLEPYCDAVDINLGCPQDAAREGHYGGYLLGQKDWPLVEQIGEFSCSHIASARVGRCGTSVSNGGPSERLQSAILP